MAAQLTNANVVFFPWVRQGAAAAIGTVDTLGPLRNSVDLTAGLAINAEPSVPVTVRLRGPADVIGIDPHEIVRMDPQPGATDFEPNNFAAIEFDRPDFPWMFTPAKADTTGRLRPWLCLIVVRAQDGVTLRNTSDAPLPSIEIGLPARPADELPDLSESWLWTHAQVASPADAGANDLGTALRGNPELSLSRLICPRLLAPATDYIACVVPTFELGKKAGLGQEITENDLTNASGLKPAWSLTPAPPTVTLPVYHQWRFRTGESGDFESLVRLLQPRAVPAALGKRPVDISQPGFTLTSPLPACTTLDLEGALQPLNLTAPPPGPTGTFQTDLARIVNAPGIAEASDPHADPLLAPPLYGRWHAARATVTPGGAPWFDELNLNPCLRSVAAFGTRVVQEHQEALMAAAWEQAADLQNANQRMRQLQLSLVVSTSLHTRHFTALSDEALLRVGSPAFGRLRAAAAGAPAGKTLVASLAASALPPRATSPAMRRIGRERGPITRRIAAQGGTRSATLTWVARLNTGSDPFVGQPWFDLASFNVVARRLTWPNLPLPGVFLGLRGYEFVREFEVRTMPGRSGFQIVPEGQAVPVPPRQEIPQTFDSPAAKAFRLAAQFHLTRINPGRLETPVTRLPPLAMTEVREGVLAQIEPTRTMVELARAIVATGVNATPPANTAAMAAAETADLPIETIMAAPKFRQPMYATLRDLSQELLLPGLDAVLPNSVLGLTTNRRFVEAYMAGLNFEMGRELLWRGFPTDQRGTYFDQFWDIRGSGEARADVRPLHEWGTGRLGDADVPPARNQFVMLLRSDLLRRYPTTAIYATRAIMVDDVRTPSTDPDDEVHPSFRGAMPPDVSFFGFDLTVEEVIGDTVTGSTGRRAFNPGYFIVIQEQPSEPHFGLDEGTPVGSGTHLRVSSGPPAGMELNGRLWGHNAAHMAGITRQQPVRVLIHASQFVPKPLTGDPIG